MKQMNFKDSVKSCITHLLASENMRLPQYLVYTVQSLLDLAAMHAALLWSFTINKDTNSFLFFSILSVGEQEGCLFPCAAAVLYRL